ncbi:hypothetical protein PaeBR_18720 [Paenibacillus sp. BR2-3]|uniref:hypothetical protein n=1 Tax=Paenibacillus sp. BR2-3 TaxID=3048494 RepID=UPI0039773647
MDLQAWREQKQTGIPADADVQDAAVQEEEEVEELERDADPDEIEDPAEDSEIDTEGEPDPEQDEEPELPEAQKTAFQKALEREKRKMKEEQDTMRSELEQQYNPYKSFFDQLGITDPAIALKAIEDNRLLKQAEQLADDQGWSDDQALKYLKQRQEQHRLSEELHDLRISNQINELADNPDYAGIKGMKEQIKSKITASGGALSAEEAYWAVGGKERAAQLKRETTQREIAKRATAKRTVQTDTAASANGEKTLPEEVRQAAKAAGISEKEARRLVDMPNDLEGYRKWKKQGRA